MKEYLNFEIEIGTGIGREYPLSITSPAGEVNVTMNFPFDELALSSHLKDLQIALLRSSSSHRQAMSSEEQTVRSFGEALFDAVFNADVRALYASSQLRATDKDKGLRLKLRILPPELNSLPWEFMFDSRHGEYICLSTKTPVIRYMELPQAIEPLEICPPLRILGMIASPNDLPELNVQNEKQRLEAALAEVQKGGKVELTWLEGQTWRDLQSAMRKGPWHIFHYVGHGGYSRHKDEGYIAVEDESGKADPLYAKQLGRLLVDHSPMRLVFLNACEGARGGSEDVFSSTASILLRGGIPSVVAMQYAISDRAAIEFARMFYESLSEGWPVDYSVTEARKSVSLHSSETLEWGTPVLFMRSPDGKLFDVVVPPKDIQDDKGTAEAPQVKSTPLTHQPAEQSQRTEEEIPVVMGGAAAAVGEAALPAPQSQKTEESTKEPPPAARSGVGGIAGRSIPIGWLAVILLVVLGAFFLIYRLAIAPGGVDDQVIETTAPLLVAALDTATATKTEPSATVTRVPATATEVALVVPSSTPQKATETLALPSTEEPTASASGLLMTPTGTPPPLGLSKNCIHAGLWAPSSSDGLQDGMLEIDSEGCWVLQEYGFSLQNSVLAIRWENSDEDQGQERGISTPLSGEDVIIELDVLIDDLDTSGSLPSSLAIGIESEDPQDNFEHSMVFYSRVTPSERLGPIFVKYSRGGSTLYYNTSGSDYVKYKTGTFQHLYFQIRNRRYILSLNNKPLIQGVSLEGVQPVFWIKTILGEGGVISARIQNFRVGQ